MRFNSVIYLAFLAAVVAVLWLLPYRARRWWLLLSSYAFYASWHWPFLSLIVGIAVVNTYGARWIVTAADRRARGRWIVAANLAVLGAFKYLDWAIENANAVGRLLGLDGAIQPPHWLLPLGVSFYVFEGLSYTIDVVRKRERAHGFWDMQLFFGFFPHLIAGPILRAKEFLPQLAERIGFDPARVSSGLWTLATGLFLKIVLADGLAPQVDEAFARGTASLGATDVMVMATAFGLQIYFDFAGYTRIAIGSARLCGLELVENFDYPYSARSPVEFWARWHMSLSRWIRDYLFYPLTGGSTGWQSLSRAAILSMVLCGLWHGAAWTFVFWGLYHGILIAGYHFVRGRVASAPDANKRWVWLRSIASLFLTFGLITAGWILFRAPTLSHGLSLLGTLLSPWAHPQRALSGTFYLHAFALLLAVWNAPWVEARLRKLEGALSEHPTAPARLAWASARGVMLALFLASALVYLRGQTAFIYFQF